MTRESNLTEASVAAGLACPECAAPLNDLGKTIQCAGCEKHWPVVNGVPHFIDSFPYWGEIPQTQMQEVNRSAEAGHWKSALTGSSDPGVQRASEMILNVARGNWKHLVALPPNSSVLDIGAGMGTNSHALSMSFERVIALEPVAERVQFMQHRFAQERLSNVRLVRSSLWTMPFPEGSFDLIAMNGVLEWVAEGRSGDPGEWQKRALKNVIRLLRPGGYLYLGIENRLCSGYFMGYPDPHCGLPFVTILPRPLAHLYARAKGRPGGYRNYLYSSRGYRKVLQSVGFTDVECHLALPTYNQPRFFIPLSGNLFNYYARTFLPSPNGGIRKTLSKWLLRLDVLKYFEYSFAIIAQKRVTPE